VGLFSYVNGERKTFCVHCYPFTALRFCFPLYAAVRKDTPKRARSDFPGAAL